MRRVLSPVTAVLALFTLTATTLAFGVLPAFAAAGEKVCTITDNRLTELSGLVALKSGYVTINDGTDDPRRERVFFLNAKCQVRAEVQYSGNGPRDPEDLALSPDGETLWIADTGANITSTDPRTTVVLWSLPADGSARPVLHRLAYPGGRTPDAEALLIGVDGIPLIVTKNVGKAEIYRPSGPLRKNNTEPVPLEKVGEVTLPKTLTPNLLGQTGRVTVTGAARSPDGKRVVLRTYADAFEWDVPDDGDVVKAITGSTPRATALADPFGEAITYSSDGRTFLTVSDLGEVDSGEEVTILRYTPATQVAAPVGDEGAEREDSRSWIDRLSLDDITYLVVAVGALGAVLVGAGVFGIVRSRRNGPAKRPGAGAVPVAGRQTALSSPNRRAGRGGPDGGAVYGRGGPAGEGRGPGDGYGPAAGERPNAGRASGGVYGAGPANGTTYGRPGAPGRSGQGGRSGTTYGSAPPGRRGAGGVYGAGGGAVYGGGHHSDDDYPPEDGRINGHWHAPGGGRPGPGRPGAPPPPGDYDYR